MEIRNYRNVQFKNKGLNNTIATRGPGHCFCKDKSAKIWQKRDHWDHFCRESRAVVPLCSPRPCCSCCYLYHVIIVSREHKKKIFGLMLKGCVLCTKVSFFLNIFLRLCRPAYYSIDSILELI